MDFAFATHCCGFILSLSDWGIFNHLSVLCFPSDSFLFFIFLLFSTILAAGLYLCSLQDQKIK